MNDSAREVQERPKVGEAAGESRKRGLAAARPELVALVVALAVAVGAVAVVAWNALDSDHHQDALAEFVKLAWQFVVLVVLGGLVGVVISLARERREREEADERAIAEQEEARRLLRESYVRRLIDCSHQVERAHWIVPANRSVKTWSDATTGELMPAFIGLRNIRHDLTTQAKAEGKPVFDCQDWLDGELNQMQAFLQDLIEEFGNNKKELSKLQRRAEEKAIDHDEWSRRQDDVWKHLQELQHLKGLLVRQGGPYGAFRKSYVDALTELRAQLAGHPGLIARRSVECSFCGNSQEAQPNGRSVIGGPGGVAICSDCVRRYAESLEANGR